MAKSQSPAQRFLREYVAKDAPAREKSVAMFMGGVSLVSALLALGLTPVIGWQLSAALTTVLGGLVVYQATLVALIRRGWFHPAVPWLNVAIEVSAPSVLFIIDCHASGAEYALTTPPLVIWGSLVGLSALRGSRTLSLCAGALAAAEYGVLYFFVAAPRLPATALITLQAPMVAVRVVLLFASGVLTVVFVTHLNRKAEEAFSAMRARDVFGKYLLHERLGAGGTAEVYRATYSPEGGFEKTVAIKRLLPSFATDERFMAMFRIEAERCSRFSHPSVVQVLDFGRFADTYFLAMEFVDGYPLRTLLNAYGTTGLAIDAVVALGIAMCEALDYVHTRAGPDGQPLGLIHRDVNPPNILVSINGEVKLTDFGLAKARGESQHTQHGQARGKPGYFAPEQAAGRPMDGRVDLFALGTTLWECLTGRRLFPGSQDERMAALFDAPIARVSSLRSDVPPELEQVVMGMLERALEKRTASAADALMVLRLLAPLQKDGVSELAECVAHLRALKASQPQGDQTL